MPERRIKEISGKDKLWEAAGFLWAMHGLFVEVTSDRPLAWRIFVSLVLPFMAWSAVTYSIDGWRQTFSGGKKG